MRHFSCRVTISRAISLYANTVFISCRGRRSQFYGQLQPCTRQEQLQRNCRVAGFSNSIPIFSILRENSICPFDRNIIFYGITVYPRPCASSAMHSFQTIPLLLVSQYPPRIQPQCSPTVLFPLSLSLFSLVPYHLHVAVSISIRAACLPSCIFPLSSTTLSAIRHFCPSVSRKRLFYIFR